MYLRLILDFPSPPLGYYIPPFRRVLCTIEGYLCVLFSLRNYFRYYFSRDVGNIITIIIHRDCE